MIPSRFVYRHGQESFRLNDILSEAEIIAQSCEAKFSLTNELAGQSGETKLPQNYYKLQGVESGNQVESQTPNFPEKQLFTDYLSEQFEAGLNAENFAEKAPQIKKWLHNENHLWHLSAKDVLDGLDTLKSKVITAATIETNLDIDLDFIEFLHPKTPMVKTIITENKRVNLLNEPTQPDFRSMVDETDHHESEKEALKKLLFLLPVNDSFLKNYKKKNSNPRIFEKTLSLVGNANPLILKTQNNGSIFEDNEYASFLDQIRKIGLNGLENIRKQITNENKYLDNKKIFQLIEKLHVNHCAFIPEFMKGLTDKADEHDINTLAKKVDKLLELDSRYEINIHRNNIKNIVYAAAKGTLKYEGIAEKIDFLNRKEVIDFFFDKTSNIYVTIDYLFPFRNDPYFGEALMFLKEAAKKVDITKLPKNSVNKEKIDGKFLFTSLVNNYPYQLDSIQPQRLNFMRELFEEVKTKQSPEKVYEALTSLYSAVKEKLNINIYYSKYEINEIDCITLDFYREALRKQFLFVLDKNNLNDCYSEMRSFDYKLFFSELNKAKVITGELSNVKLGEPTAHFEFWDEELDEIDLETILNHISTIKDTQKKIFFDNVVLVIFGPQAVFEANYNIKISNLTYFEMVDYTQTKEINGKPLTGFMLDFLLEEQKDISRNTILRLRSMNTEGERISSRERRNVLKQGTSKQIFQLLLDGQAELDGSVLNLVFSGYVAAEGTSVRNRFSRWLAQKKEKWGLYPSYTIVGAINKEFNGDGFAYLKTMDSTGESWPTFLQILSDYGKLEGFMATINSNQEMKKLLESLTHSIAHSESESKQFSATMVTQTILENLTKDNFDMTAYLDSFLSKTGEAIVEDDSTPMKRKKRIQSLAKKSLKILEDESMSNTQKSKQLRSIAKKYTEVIDPAAVSNAVNDENVIQYFFDRVQGLLEESYLKQRFEVQYLIEQAIYDAYDEVADKQEDYFASNARKSLITLASIHFQKSDKGQKLTNKRFETASITPMNIKRNFDRFINPKTGEETDPKDISYQDLAEGFGYPLTYIQSLAPDNNQANYKEDGRRATSRRIDIYGSLQDEEDDEMRETQVESIQKAIVLDESEKQFQPYLDELIKRRQKEFTVNRFYLLASTHVQSVELESAKEKDLFPNGQQDQVYLFYGDEDGKISFNSMLQQYKINPKKIRKATSDKPLNSKNGWKGWTEKVNNSNICVLQKSVKGRKTNIYIVDPTTNLADRTTGNASLVSYLQKNNIKTEVFVHRGHSTWVDKSINFLNEYRYQTHGNSAIKIVNLGSCSGYGDLYEVAPKTPGAHFFATKGTGSASVNDPVLFAMNNWMIENGNIEWADFEHAMNQKFKVNKDKQPVGLGNSFARSRYKDYIFPHNNQATQVMLMNKIQGENDTLPEVDLFAIR